MRRAAMVLLLLAAGCASAGSHSLGIAVFEPVTTSPLGGFQAVTLLGQHMLRVQIENRSHQDITVHSIQIEPVGSDLFTNDPSQQVEELIGAGETRSFDISLDVSTSSRMSRPTSQLLQSVAVNLACTGSETGDFIDSGTYDVNHVASGN